MVQRCASLQLEGPPEKAALTQPMTPTPSLAGPGPGAPERGGTPRQYDGVRETGAVPGDRGGLRERRGVQAEHVVIPDSGGNGVEAERMEIERKEAERREAKRKEAERREIERREVERREAERREGQQTMSDRAEAHRQAEPASAPPPNHRPRPPSTPPSATSDARRPTHPSDTAAIASESPTLRPEQSLFGPDDDDDSDIDLPGLSVPSGGAHSAALSPGVGTDPFGGPDSPGVAINGSEDLGREASGLMVSHSQSWGAGGLRAEYSQPSLREQFGNG